MPHRKNIIDLRLTLTQDDPLYNAFNDIKKASGIKNSSDVLRFILKQLSKIPFSELITKFENNLDKPTQKVEA